MTAALMVTAMVATDRLDQILGKQSSKGKDVYDTKYCLASRIVNVERQVAIMMTATCSTRLQPTAFLILFYFFFSFYLSFHLSYFPAFPNVRLYRAASLLPRSLVKKIPTGGRYRGQGAKDPRTVHGGTAAAPTPPRQQQQQQRQPRRAKRIQQQQRRHRRRRGGCVTVVGDAAGRPT